MDPATLGLSEAQLDARVSDLQSILDQPTLGTPQWKAQYEPRLLDLRANPWHFVALVEYLRRERGSLASQLLAALEIKNILKDNYVQFANARESLNDPFLNLFKAQLLGLYLDPKLLFGAPKVFRILQDALKLLIPLEFPAHWPELLPAIVASLSHNNHEGNYSGLSLLKVMTADYPYRMVSEESTAEILVVLEHLHDTIMSYCQGYINILTGEGIRPEVALRMLSLLLRVSANLLAQGPIEAVEANAANWTKVIRSLFQTTHNERIEALLKTQPAPSGQLRPLHEIDILEGWFECKGEAVKILTILAGRYDEDLDTEMDSFAQRIWENCLAYASSPDFRRNRLLTHSIKYFRSLASSQKYFEFFENNVSEIIVKLIIPAFSGDTEPFELFQSDCDAYVESLLMIRDLENKTKGVIRDFINTLTRHHRNAVFGVVEEMLKQLLVAKSLDNAQSEVLFLEIFYDVSIQSFNDAGATAIFCPLNFLTHVYGTFIEGTLGMLAQNLPTLTGQTLSQALFLVTRYLQFMWLFQNFLGFERISDAIVQVFCDTIRIPHQAYQNVLIEFLGKVLTTRAFTLKDSMNAPSESTLTPYQRLVRNPPRIELRSTDGGFIFNPTKKPEQFGLTFQALVWVMCQSTSNLNQRSIRTLLNSLDLVKEGGVASFLDPLFGLVDFALQGLKSGALGLNFSVVNELFEIISNLIQRSPPANQDRLQALLQTITGLANHDSLELTALVIQSAALYVRVFAVNPQQAPQSPLAVVFKQVLSPQAYTEKHIGIVFSYFLFLQEAILATPDLLCSQEASVNSVLAACNRLLQLRTTFDFLKFVAIHKLPIDNFIPSSIAGLDNFYQFISSSSEEAKKFVFMRPTFLKEFFEFVCIFSVVHSFESLVAKLRSHGLETQFRAILVNEDCVVFLSQNCSRPFRYFMLVSLSRILFHEQAFFQTNHYRTEFRTLLDCALENIWRSKFAASSLKTNFEAKRFENQKFDELTDSNFTNIYRLRAFPDVAEKFMVKFWKDLQFKGSADAHFLDTLKNFMIHTRVQPKDIGIQEKHLALL
jgi:hypothetical protein